jgi:hypothetical protein
MRVIYVFFLSAAFSAALLAPTVAAAQEEKKTEPAETAPSAPLAELAAKAPAPPPLHVPYLQYGLSIAGEFVLAPGPICSVTTQPPSCVLNSGGGIGIRVGVRTAGPWYFGGSYEFSKQDPDSLYRLAILQQARAEMRYYIETGRDIEPMGMAGLGVAGYGNEWGLDTGGGVASLGIGAEIQISRRIVAGVALSYRALYLGSFTDSSDTRRTGGITSIMGLELILEARDPLL